MAYVRLKDVTLRIPIYDAGALRLFRRGGASKGGVGSHEFSGKRGVLEVQPLSNINLNLESGDRVALIGHNGAGKTTLLRYLAGIYPAASGVKETQGSVYLYGGMNAINQDASGYENIKLAIQLGGLPKNKTQEYIKDIEQFTELGEYLNMPTRIYSMGMMARLSFAIATMHSPDILLIDEGIGAGDAKFADKVEARIHNFTQKASIMVFASHSDALVTKMCNKGAVFEAGRMVYFGEVGSALHYYRGSIAAKPAPQASHAG